MKLNTIRLLFVAVVLAAALSWALDSPELPMEPDGYRFQFGVSLLAEDCDDGSAENQQCGGSFGIDSTTVSSGGGGGQQRVPVFGASPERSVRGSVLHLVTPKEQISVN